MSMYGITGYGAYVPRLWMRREAMADRHRSRGEAHEDSIAMAVEAALDVLGDVERARIESLTMATTAPELAELQGASIVADALELPQTTRTCEIGKSQRAGVNALLAQLSAAAGNVLFIASGLPTTTAAAAQGRRYGAGAAAFTLGDEGVIAELIGAHSLWNVLADGDRGRHWVSAKDYAGIVPQAVAAALHSATLHASEVDHFIFASPHKGSSAEVAQRCGISVEAVDVRMDERCGHASAAHPCLMLAATLERCKPGEVLVVVGFGRGCDVLVLRATVAIDELKPRRRERALAVGYPIRNAAAPSFGACK